MLQCFVGIIDRGRYALCAVFIVPLMQIGVGARLELKKFLLQAGEINFERTCRRGAGWKSKREECVVSPGRRLFYIRGRARSYGSLRNLRILVSGLMMIELKDLMLSSTSS